MDACPRAVINVAHIEALVRHAPSGAGYDICTIPGLAGTKHVATEFYSDQDTHIWGEAGE